eukprot:110421_1
MSNQNQQDSRSLLFFLNLKIPLPVIVNSETDLCDDDKASAKDSPIDAEAIVNEIDSITAITPPENGLCVVPHYNRNQIVGTTTTSIATHSSETKSNNISLVNNDLHNTNISEESIAIQKEIEFMFSNAQNKFDELGINTNDNFVCKDEYMSETNGWFVDKDYYDNHTIEFEYDPSFIYHGVAI